MMFRSKTVAAIPDLDSVEPGARRRRKVSVLRELIGALDSENCVLLTQGNGNAGLYARLRQAGGRWCWAELDPISAPEPAGSPDEAVLAASHARLPFADAAFERAVVVDVHLPGPGLPALGSELARILRPNGVAIVHASHGKSRRARVPGRWVRRAQRTSHGGADGSYMDRLEASLAAAGLEPLVRTSYGGVFTELAEYVHGLTEERLADSVVSNGTAEAARRPWRGAGIRGVVLRILSVLSALDVLTERRVGRAAALAAIKPG